MSEGVIIVDYRLGNLYNVMRACQYVGLGARISSSPADVSDAAAVILPGVGAFGDAMNSLRHSGLDRALRSFASSGRPLLGICLGMQLLLSESQEFGPHHGLGIVPGAVVRFPASRAKVPQVGWNGIRRPVGRSENPWYGTLLEGIEDGSCMYFVHSYCAVPEDPSVVLSTTCYGDVEFCSSLRCGNITGFQFHPERSGSQGVQIYRRFAGQLKLCSGLSPSLPGKTESAASSSPQ